MSNELSRGDFFGVSAVGSAVVGAATHGSALRADPAGSTSVGLSSAVGTLRMRWYGGGVYELATPDDKTIVIVDAWIWNNTGFTAFGIEKPAELSSPVAYAAYLKGRNPDAVVVALSHDHGDHMGDYFTLLPALIAAGIDVKTIGQSDLMRVGLVAKFAAAGIDPSKVVLNGGAGINMGGTATYKGARFELVPAVHSTASGFPAAGFIIDIGDVRVYASGDTDVYGDMALVGMRYHPDLAIVSSGNGAFTMGPDDAALACKLVGAGHAIPVHYAHNPLVVGTHCGELFQAAMGRVAPQVAVTVVRPGTVTTLHVARNSGRA